MPTHFSIKPGCTVHPFDGTHGDEYILETADARRYRMSGTAIRLLERLDEGTPVEELCEDFGHMDSGELRTFIVRNYGPFLIHRTGEPLPDAMPPAPAPAKSGLLVSWTILPGGITAGLSSWLSTLYSPIAASIIVLCIVAAHWLFYTSAPAAAAAVGGSHVSAVLLLCVASILAHELGHASALARYGGVPTGIGFGFFILLPVFYADVSQAWKLRRTQRVVVDLGGVYFQQIFFLLTAIPAVLFRDPSLRAVCIGIDIMTLIALNPAFRFDGYWVLADWLGLSNLHRSASLYLRRLFRRIGRSQPAWGETPRGLTPARTRVFICYALLSNVFLAGLIVLNLKWLQSAAEGLWRGLPLLAVQWVEAVSAGDWLRSVDLSVACVFLILSGMTVFIALFCQARMAARALRRRPTLTSIPSSNSPGA
jgi:putative peptide zinc metalloprotease protein